jgi:hypothetical protein
MQGAERLQRLLQTLGQLDGRALGVDAKGCSGATAVPLHQGGDAGSDDGDHQHQRESNGEPARGPGVPRLADQGHHRGRGDPRAEQAAEPPGCADHRDLCWRRGSGQVQHERGRDRGDRARDQPGPEEAQNLRRVGEQDRPAQHALDKEGAERA